VRWHLDCSIETYFPLSMRPRSRLPHLVIFALAALAARTSWADEHHLDKLDGALRDALRSNRNGTRSVIIQTDTAHIAALRDRLKAHGHGDAIDSTHPAIGVVSASVDAADLHSLAADGRIHSISSNAVVRAFASSGSSAESPVNVLRETLGLSSSSPMGNGIGVAVIDSGIQPSKDFEGRIVAFYDFVKRGGQSTSPYDDFGHGTHVAGLIGSSGALAAAYRGVAPAVRLIGMKVLNSRGTGRTSDVISAITFATANKERLGIDVINLSLGHPIYEPAASDPLVQAVEAAVGAGIIVVAAAGNYGVNPETGQAGFGGITSPGNAPSAITVGTFDHRGTAARADDRVPSYSSSGPTWYDTFAKPDLVAPGHRLVSNASRPSLLYKDYSSIRVDSNHIRLSGTSVSAAVASGVVALVLEANRTGNRYPPHRSITPNAVRAALEYTALGLSDDSGRPYHPLEQGAGGLNAAGAIELARRLDTSAPIGSWWLTSGLEAFTTIAGQPLAWTQDIIWGTRILQGTAIFVHEQAWGDDIIWGTLHDDDIIWGTFDRDDIIWGTSADDIIWGTNVVWGPDRLGTTEGTDIIWGTFDPDDIVWGTLFVDDIIWGTLRRADDIIWGTALFQ
jgi:serine protease AprX